MDARCVLLLALCARLLCGASDTGKPVSPPAPAHAAPEDKKDAFAARLQTNLRRSNEEYEGSAGGKEGEGPRPPGARRHAAPRPTRRPPAPALPRDGVWRQDEQAKVYLIQQSREYERHRKGPVQEEKQRNMEREAQEREKIVVDVEREEMMGARQNTITREELVGERLKITPVRQKGDFWHEKVRGDESQMEIEQEQAIWVSDEGEREAEGRLLGAGELEGEGRLVGDGEPKREGRLVRGERPEREDEVAGAAAKVLMPLMGAPEGEGTPTSAASRPVTKRVRGHTVAHAHAFRGVRMTMQGIVDDEEQSEARAGPAGAGDAAGAADTREEGVVAVGEGVDMVGEGPFSVGEEPVGVAEGPVGAGEGGDLGGERVAAGIDGAEKGEQRDKVEKLRSFLRNNKDMLKKFILEKRKQRKMATSSLPVRARDPPASTSTPTPIYTHTYTPMTFHPPRARVGVLTATQLRGGVVAASGGGGGGGGVLVHEGGGGKGLSAHHLDLAPARGSRVLAMRQRGRLCQRNVLMPEGPKYDSKGAVYLLAYNRTRFGGRDYSATKPPQLLLPACCNCCKKSVLGCE